MHKGCDAPPEHECIWADGRAHAWFCGKHYEPWKKERGDWLELVKERKVKGGEVGKRYGEEPKKKASASRVAQMFLSRSKVAAPEKYKHINFKPPEGVAKEAEKGLEYRRKSGKGGLTTEQAGKSGIGSGVQRAVNLKNRDEVSPETIKKMVGFFSRHEKNKDIAEENKGTPWEDAGYVAWLLWGGDAGRSWAEKVLRQMEAADEKAKQASTDREAKNVPTNPKLWEKAVAEAKKRFDIYPSAYANGWAAKWYKERGGGWKKEEKKKARGKAKKDVGHGGLDEWFSGHGGGEGDATWGDWVAISPVKKTLPSGKKVDKGDIVGPCAISDDPDWKDFTKDGKDPLKCMPRAKAHDMGKKERAEKAVDKMKAERKDKNKGKKPTLTPTFKKDKKAQLESWGPMLHEAGYHAPSYMSVQNLREMGEHSEDLLTKIDENTQLPDWVESLLTESAVQLRNVYEYMAHGKTAAVTGNGTSVGLFIPLPAELATQYPEKEEDSSPAHVTFLYIGEVAKADEPKFVEALERAFQQIKGPVEAVIGEPDRFMNQDNKVVFSRVRFSEDLHQLRDEIRESLEHQGVEVGDSFPRWNPHITIEYMGHGDEWEGEPPTGRWAFDSIEVWGLSKKHVIPFGERIDLTPQRGPEIGQRRMARIMEKRARAALQRKNW